MGFLLLKVPVVMILDETFLIMCIKKMRQKEKGSGEVTFHSCPVTATCSHIKHLRPAGLSQEPVEQVDISGVQGEKNSAAHLSTAHQVVPGSKFELLKNKY